MEKLFHLHLRILPQRRDFIFMLRYIMITILFLYACDPKNKHEEQENQSVQQKSNHLANETSPYLLQHADNPVNWYPWGEEARPGKIGR